MEQRFVSLYLLLAALLMATLPCHADTPGSLSVSINNNAEFVELTGPWAFYWNRFLPPGQEPAEQPTAMVRLPGSWTRINSTEQPLPVTGFASYRLQVDLGDTPPPSLKLQIPMVYSAYRLYLNGELAVSVGTPGTTAETSQPDYGERIVHINKPGHSLTLLFHVSNFTSRNAGMPKPLALGLPGQIERIQTVHLISSSALAGGLFLIGLSQLILFVIRRGDVSYLLFGLTVTFWSLHTILSGQLLEKVGWHIPVTLARPLDGFSAMATATSYLLFLSALFPKQLPFRFTTPALALIPLYLAFAIFGSQLLRSQVTGWLLYLLAFLMIAALFSVFRAWRQGEPDAGFILIGAAVVALTAMLQTYWFNKSGIRNPVANFGVLAAMGLHSITLARRYARAFEHSRRLEQQLRKANRLKDEFLANTSHELRTPLHAIIGLAESLPRATPELDRGLQLIQDSGRRLTRLVEDILAFTRLKHNDLSLKQQPTPIAPIIQAVLDICRPLAGHRPVTLRHDIDPRVRQVLADPDRLHQILFNLVQNAVKFTDQGEVIVSVKHEGETALITVRDTGIGIPAADLERIQNPYEQSHESSLDGRGGFGLGLAICRELLARHGSELELDSHMGEGTCAGFRLPISTAPIISGPEDHRPQPSPQPKAARKQSRKPDKYLLIVDDDTIAAAVLEQQLRQAGYQVRTLYSGMDALEAVRKQPPELILLDVMMPGMSGLEVCRRLREEFDANTLPIILVTARTRPEDIVEGLNAGANDYLAKPFWHKEMLARVNAQLRVRENEQMRWALRQQEAEAGACDDPRAQVVELLNTAVGIWEIETGKTRADLAEESGLWTVTLDNSSRKTRTLDRYMSIETLPKRPRWGIVNQTARFVAEHIRSENKRQTLLQMCEALELSLELPVSSET